MKAKVFLLFVIGLLFLPLHQPNLNARGKQFKGILPPEQIDRVYEEESPPGEEVTEGEGPTFPNLNLVINIPARQVVLYDEGKEVFRHDVAVGQPIYKTPAGPQEVTTIIWNPSWIPPNSPWARGASPAPPGPNNPLGPVKLMMGSGIRLHGTNVDSSVGRYASHGCLRMHNDEVSELAWYIQKRINNSEDLLYEKYKKNRYSSFYIKLDFPLSVEIVYEPIEVKNDKLYIYADAYRWGGNIKAAAISALLKGGINLNKIDAEKLEELKYPNKKYDVTEIEISSLLIGAPKNNSSVASNE